MLHIGIYGGAFDPPHLAHLSLVQQALVQLPIDHLHILPTGRAWHKVRQLSPAHHRLAMCRLAFAGLEKVVVDERETRREGASYTVDSLRELRAHYADSAFYLIVGQDQFDARKMWHEWMQIDAWAQWVVCPRAQGAQNSDNRDIAADEFASGHEMLRLTASQLPHSSSDIRARLQNGANLTDWLSPAVTGYIEQHQLYRNFYDDTHPHPSRRAKKTQDQSGLGNAPAQD
jgi:nicotinate-nucleotide adenylyltransferase